VENQASQVLESALHLPQSDRAFIAEKLIESLDVDEDSPISDEWLQEIRRRCASTDKGEVELIPAEKVIEKVLESLE